MNGEATDLAGSYDVAAVIAAQAERLFEEHATPARLRQLLDEPGSFDRQLWRAAIDLGWLAGLIEAGETPAWDTLADLSRMIGR